MCEYLINLMILLGLWKESPKSLIVQRGGNHYVRGKSEFERYRPKIPVEVDNFVHSFVETE